MSYIVSTDNPLPLTLCESDEVLSILQNIALLLSTKKGTVPGYRNFGLPMNYIGKPLIVAETVIQQEISEAIEEFEPRAKLVAAELTSGSDGKMKITVEVDVET